MLRRFLLSALVALTLAGVGASGQSIHVNDNGTLREIAEVYVNDNGTLRQIQEGYINDNGTLRQFFAAATVTVSGESISDSDSPGPVEVRLRFNSNGTVDRYINSGYSQIDSLTDWVIPNSASSNTYYIRLTVDSGTTPSGSATASCLTLGNGSSREWTLTRQAVSGSGSTTGTYTVEISDDSCATTLDSGSYTLTATIL